MEKIKNREIMVKLKHLKMVPPFQYCKKHETTRTD